jgi:hypothetical protein
MRDCSVPSRHRFRNLFDQLDQSRPSRPTATASMHSFVVCPVALMPCQPMQVSWQQQVYQAAFQQAQAVVRPSLLERDLLAAWN